MNKKLILVFSLILIILIGGIIIAILLGVFQRPAQPDPSDICYGTNIEILDCSFSAITKKAQVNLKLSSGKVEGIQGLISGKLVGSIAGSEDIVELEWNAPHQQIVEFNFEKTVDGISLDNFEGPYNFQVRPILEGKNCIQFDTKKCKSI